MAVVMQEDYLSEEYMTPDEVAKIMRVSRNQVTEMINGGELPAIRFGKKLWRIRKTDLQNYLSRNYTRQAELTEPEEEQQA